MILFEEYETEKENIFDKYDSKKVTWYKFDKLSETDIETLLDHPFLDWHGELDQDPSCYDYKYEMYMIHEILSRPEWTYGNGMFVKRILKYDQENKLVDAEVRLVYKKENVDGRFDYSAVVYDPLLIFLFNQELAIEVYDYLLNEKQEVNNDING
jgi:hypothetical protein